ncbi:MAG: PCMD domain-containing protein [Prevotellamassilia sp.]|nr:PCMD domain-containing protein [Prevotellamassilia sp.]
MKKQLLTLALLASGSLSCLAQYQLPNSDFESDFVVAYTQRSGLGTKWVPYKYTHWYEPLHWHGYATAENHILVDPRSGDKLKSADSDRPNAGKCAYIEANSVAGFTANGVMTTGRIYVGEMSTDGNNNYNYSKPGNTDTKNSSYQDGENKNSDFFQTFTGKPDVMTVWVKFIADNATQTSKAPYASVNAVIHDATEFRDPEKTGTDYSDHKVAQAQNTTIANYGQWHQLSVPFDYDDTKYKSKDPQYILVTFSTNAKAGGGTSGDQLYIDDIAMVYYNDLKTLTYGTGSDVQDLLAKAGKAVGNVVSIDASDLFYEKSKVAFKKRGQGANITEEKYDPATCILTIKVEANDISVNAKNYTIYKVQFKKPITISDDQNVITTKDDNAKVIMTRTFKKGWNTICLPFSTTAEALGAANVQELTDCTNDLINFKRVEGNMQWNTPYLIYFNEEKAFTSEDPFIFAGQVASSGQSTGVTFSPVTMRGNYKVNFSMKGCYGVVDQDGVQRIMSGGEGATLGPCRAYFQTSKAGANGMLINFDGQTTGITAAELNAEGAAEDAPIYNLQGVRVNHLTKGVYIKGGKKIIVK